MPVYLEIIVLACFIETQPFVGAESAVEARAIAVAKIESFILETLKS